MQLIKEPNKLIVKYSSIGFGAVLMAAGAAFFYQLYIQYMAHPNRFTDKMGGVAFGGALCFLVGWLSAVTKIYTFDKVSGNFSWVKRRLLWSSRGEMKLSEIKRVVVEKGGLSSGSQSNITRLSIWTDYKTIPFTASLTNRGLADYSLAKEIKSFIGLREEDNETDMPPLESRINSLLNGGNKIEATKLIRRESGLPLKDSREMMERLFADLKANGSISGVSTSTTVMVNGKEVTGEEAEKIMQMMQSHTGRSGSQFVENKESS